MRLHARLTGLLVLLLAVTVARATNGYFTDGVGVMSKGLAGTGGRSRPGAPPRQ
ncbi:MAG TPA: hypothetical protein VFN79_11430 [Steroidobacteraceae bacterium]|nr:hypothetical protein [Steroidobacteraceae bacterium]